MKISSLIWIIDLNYMIGMRTILARQKDREARVLPYYLAVGNEPEMARSRGNSGEEDRKGRARDIELYLKVFCVCRNWIWACQILNTLPLTGARFEVENVAILYTR